MRLTGWSLEEIEAAPAARLDWLLAMDRAAGRVAHTLAKRAAAEAGGS